MVVIPHAASGPILRTTRLFKKNDASRKKLYREKVWTHLRNISSIHRTYYDLSYRIQDLLTNRARFRLFSAKQASIYVAAWF
jgi:hypothetical protein